MNPESLYSFCLDALRQDSELVQMHMKVLEKMVGIDSSVKQLELKGGMGSI